MRKIAFLVLSSILFSVSAAPAQAVTVSDFELSGVVQVLAYDNIHDEYYNAGTGFLTDYVTGCVVTATHVLLDEDDTLKEIVEIVFNAGTEEEEVYSARVLAAYSDTDVAFVCMNDEAFIYKFRPYFMVDSEALQNISVGDNLTTFGYPLDSGSTITASFGQVTGFLSVEEDRDILKTDVELGGGISGAPVLTDDKAVVGMFVSQNVGEDGMPTSYAVSADILNRMAIDMAESIMELAEEAGMEASPEGCAVDENEGVYVLNGNAYYDMYCTVAVDEPLEERLQLQYEYWCGEELQRSYARNAADILRQETRELSFDDWHVYLTDSCGELDEDDIHNYATPEQTLGARLIKSAEFSAVYAVLADGKRHAFPTQAVYESWYGEDFSEIETVSSEELASYKIGENITFQPGSLIKIPSIAKVYMVADEGELRWMVDEDTARSLHGSDWAKSVHDVSEAFFMNYAGVGEEIQL